MTSVNLKNLISPSFYELHKHIKNETYTHYWLKGGRGSTKSSFISIELILGILKDKNGNAVVLRKVGKELRGSVYSQVLWAIDKLGLNEYFDAFLSPLQIVYKPTGQVIVFRGLDNPRKTKSIKFKSGYCKFIWYEEIDEFTGMEEVRMTNQSLIRGGEKFNVFYSYNPPKSQRNWVNNEVLIQREDGIVHHSTYISVPKEWLGSQFFIEALHIEKTKPDKYKNEYLGEVTGTGGEIFNNINIRKITYDEVLNFNNIRRGIDFGYSTDPFAYGAMHYDRKRKRLYIFHEIYKVGLSNIKAVELIKQENKNNRCVIAESAEPKSIDEMKSYGLNIKGAKKGPDSIDYGIKFLQDLEEIVIDNERCPNTAKEFLSYELESDGNDGFKAHYPDKNNHTIDMVRYALSEDMTFKKGLKVGIRNRLNI